MPSHPDRVKRNYPVERPRLTETPQVAQADAIIAEQAIERCDHVWLPLGDIPYLGPGGHRLTLRCRRERGHAGGHHYYAGATAN